MKLEFVLYSMQRVLVGTMQSRQKLLQSTAGYEGSFHFKKFLHSIFDCSLMDTRVLYAVVSLGSFYRFTLNNNMINVYC